MPAMQLQIWEELCQKFSRLKVSSIYYPSQQKDYWNYIFKSYEWIEPLKPRYLTPVLMFPEKEGSYIYLFLLREKNKPHNELIPSDYGYHLTYLDKNLERARTSLFKAIRQSLRSYTPGEHPWEMQFANFTLNMSGILLADSPHLLPCPQLYKDQSNKSVEIAVYPKGVTRMRPIINSRRIAQCSIGEYECFQLWEPRDDVEQAINRHLRSLNLV